jgi:hypothetical protein
MLFLTMPELLLGRWDIGYVIENEISEIGPYPSVPTADIDTGRAGGATE